MSESERKRNLHRLVTMDTDSLSRELSNKICIMISHFYALTDFALIIKFQDIFYNFLQFLHYFFATNLLSYRQDTSSCNKEHFYR
jgi:hypothetical protein